MKIVTIIQTVLALLLIAAILIQQRGGGLGGSAFGGDNSMYSTRRGAEKVIFIATIIFAVLFMVFSLARILL